MDAVSEPFEAIEDVWAYLDALLIEDYRRSTSGGADTNFQGMLQWVADEVQKLETVWQELLPLLDVDTVSGAQLDVLGRIACIARNGRSDAAYRVEIKASLTSHFSGTPEQILAFVKNVTDSDAVAYYPEYPASYWISLDGSGLTQAILDRLSPAGVLGRIACVLMDSGGDDELILTATGDTILVHGPCPIDEFPLDRVWDGGLSETDTGTIAVKWPFRDGTGIGQYPDAGTDDVSASENYTFNNGTYAEG